MEDQLTQKTAEFLLVIDQVKRYRALLGALPDAAIIICLAFVGAFASDVSGRLGHVFSSPIYNIVNGLSILFILLGLVGAFLWVYRKMRKTKVGEWKTTIEEGAPGAIKLLQNINWEETFKDIRYAKLGFWLFGLLRTSALWLGAFGLSFVFAAVYIDNVAYAQLNFLFIGLFALAFVLAISTNDFKKRFNQIGQLDNLLWELRWFDNDFRRNPFQT